MRSQQGVVNRSFDGSIYLYILEAILPMEQIKKPVLNFPIGLCLTMVY